MAEDSNARERLAHVREVLAAQVVFEGDSTSWALAAIDRFLRGEAASLDDAFGLGAAAHRPADTARRFELACRAQDLRDALISWKTIADEFGAAGESITSERAIQRLVKEFEVQLVARAVSRRLDDHDHDRKSGDF